MRAYHKSHAAIGRRRDTAAPWDRKATAATERSWVKARSNFGVLEVAHVQGAARSEGDQRARRVHRNGVDPLALQVGDNLEAVGARPDQLAIVAAGDDPLARRMQRRAQDRAVVRLDHFTRFEAHRPVAQGEGGGFPFAGEKGCGDPGFVVISSSRIA